MHLLSEFFFIISDELDEFFSKKYNDDNEEMFDRCQICQLYFRPDDGTRSQALRHLQQSHPKAYRRVTGKAANTTSTENIRKPKQESLKSEAEKPGSRGIFIFYFSNKFQNDCII